MADVKKLGDTLDWSGDRTLVDRLWALWDEGHSTAEIGRRMGTSKNAICGAARRFGLPARGSPLNGAPIDVSDEAKALARQLWAEGHTGREVAIRTGIPESSVKKKTAWLDLPPHGSLGRATLLPLPSVSLGLTEPVLAVPRAPVARERPTRAVRAPAPPAVGMRGVKAEPVPIERVKAVPVQTFTWRPGRCQWTDSDAAPWVWCDAPTDRHPSWCPAHYRRVFIRSGSVERFAEAAD